MKIAKDLRFYKGLIAEFLGCIYLLIKGYKILKWNYKIKATAQIDIIAQKHGIVRVIEVKFRKKHEDAIEAISFNQQQRLRYSANLLANRYKKDVIIDGLFFSLDKPYILHLKNIF